MAVKRKHYTNNTVSDSGISLRWLSGGTIVTGNTFVNGGLSVYECYHNTVDNNTVNGKPLVYLEGVSHHTVSDAGQVILVNCDNINVKNLDLSNTNVGLKLWETDNCNITGNTLSNNSIGILTKDSCNNTITDNIFLDGGIDLSKSPGNTVIGNTFINGGLFVSDFYNNEYNGVVEHNTVNGKPLVYLENVSYYTVSDAGQVILVNCSNIEVKNSDLSNTTVGLELVWTDYCHVTGNTISGNSKYGIFLVSSSNNTIIRNIISENNKYGIFVVSSNNNHVYNNYFDNMNNAMDFGDSTWNSLSPVNYSFNTILYSSQLGNYWSDYTGNDTYNDGIGDTPYDIKENF